MNSKKKTAFAAALVIVAGMLSGCGNHPEKSSYDEVPETIITDYKEPEDELSRPDAADDFYGYVNFDTLMGLEIGYGMDSAGPVSDSIKEAELQTNELIESIVNSTVDFPYGSTEEQIKRIWEQYTSFRKADDETEKIFHEVLEKIGQADTVDSLMLVCADLLKDYGVKTFIIPEAEMNTFTPSEYGASVGGMNEFMQNKFMFFTERLGAFREIVRMYLRCSGVSESEADKRSDDISVIIADIANSTEPDTDDMLKRVSFAEKKTADQMKDILSSFDFQKYTERVSGAFPDEFCVYDIKRLEKINELLVPENLTALKDIACISFVSAYAEFAPSSYSSFTVQVGGFSKKRSEKDALKYINDVMKDQLGKLYYDRYIDEGAKEKAEEFCEKIREGYRNLINDSVWADAGAKKQLTEKLDNIMFLVGYPECDDKKTVAGSSYFETEVNNNRAAVNTDLTLCGKPFDRSGFKMSAMSANACYAQDNTVTVPAAVLKAPFFDPSADFFENAGGFGSVIAHEISHAFDSYGMYYDSRGKYNPEWLPEKERKLFEEKKAETENYFSQWTVMDVYHVKAKETLGENLADLGAVECILKMASSDEEKKNILERYAAFWCCLEEYGDVLFKMKNDVHSPNIIRVNAVIASSDDFYRLYDVDEKDKMYIAPEQRVGRWLG